MQDALRFASRIEFLRKILNMRFDKYSYETHENALSKSFDNILENLKSKLASKEPTIMLVDPQTRLEERVIELADKTSADFKAVKEIISHQLDEVESKLRNSQQRLEDNLVEMSRKNVTNFESTKDDSAEQLSDLEKKVVKINKELSNNLQQFAHLTSENFLEQKKALTSLTNSAHNQYFENQKKNDDTLDTVYAKTQDISKSIEKTNEANTLQFNKVTDNFVVVQNRMNLFQVELEKIINRINEIKGDMAISEYKLNEIESLGRRTIVQNKVEQALNKIEDLAQKQLAMDAELRSEKQFLRTIDSKLDELLRINRDQAGVQRVESVVHTPSASPNLTRSAFGRTSQTRGASSRDPRRGFGDDDTTPI